MSAEYATSRKIEVAREPGVLDRRVCVGSSALHGRGVFANRRIRQGQYIGSFEGVPTQTDGTHVLWVTEEDGTNVGIRGKNCLRFLNHSSNPNAEFEGLRLYALRNIQAGAEVVFDYGEEWADIE